MRREEPITRLMTETVVVIDVDRPVSEVLECFRQYGFHHLPVVRGGRLAGMLSSADLLKLEHFLPRGAAHDTRFVDERFSLERLMRTPVVRLHNHATIGEAAETMISSGVHALPVVDADERVVGIVTSTDLIQSLLNGPPRRAATAGPFVPPADATGEQVLYYRKPADKDFASALAAAAAQYVEDCDPRFTAKTLLYLAQRRTALERVLVCADRFLRAGQDEHNHAQLLKAILAARRIEEHATGEAAVPFPLE
jgi:CBS domain-containing protein